MPPKDTIITVVLISEGASRKKGQPQGLKSLLHLNLYRKNLYCDTLTEKFAGKGWHESRIWSNPG